MLLQATDSLAFTSRIGGNIHHSAYSVCLTTRLAFRLGFESLLIRDHSSR
jgi:hypothetical protein